MVDWRRNLIAQLPGGEAQYWAILDAAARPGIEEQEILQSIRSELDVAVPGLYVNDSMEEAILADVERLFSGEVNLTDQ